MEDLRFECVMNKTVVDFHTDASALQESPTKTVAVIRHNPLLEFAQFLQEQFQLVEERMKQRELQLQQVTDG
jgi:hypothetical protein